ncbi:hypothetical protein LCGC14_0978500 [marine sediment metagenome]|uniref:Uncharacterized protein n=1 Tax=marine sediment metagenome TaxID=412755 RepID=A0A0F9RFZ9_9ZZZZ
MNYRMSELLASESANTAATKTIDINLAKPISRITVQIKGTNNLSVPTAHPAKMISKIELVDGSMTIFSLSGIQCQALDYYQLGRMPTTVMEFRNDVMAIPTFELNFGRYLWDEVLAFDPSKFVNPQLKITHNKALGGSAPDAATLTVNAFVFDDKEISPTGYLMQKEQFSYTLVASAAQQIDLAVDYPYRSLMIQSLTGGKQPWENYNSIKLSEDHDASVLINGQKTSDLLKLFKDQPDIVEYVHALDLNGGVTCYCTPTYQVGIVGLGIDAFNGSLYSAQSYGGTFSATGDNNEHAAFMISGSNPHGAMQIPFGKPEIIEDWYNTSDIGSLILTITAGSGASGTVEIISEQIKTY